MENYIDKLEKIVHGITKKKNEIKPTDPLQEIIISSLTFVMFLAEIERVFSIEIPEEELDPANFKDLDSVNKLINRICANIN